MMMTVNYESVRTLAIATFSYVFGYFLSVNLLEYLIYDNDSPVSNIILFVVVLFTRIYLMGTDKSPRTQEEICLAIFLLHDMSVVDMKYVLLLFGVACVREHLIEEPIIKELVSFACGLIFLLMGWSSVGRILVVYFLVVYMFLLFELLFMTAVAINQNGWGILLD